MRRNLTRRIPAGSLAIRLKGVDAVAYATRLPNGRVVLCCYAGRAVQPTKHYSFKTDESAATWLEDWRQSLLATARCRVEQRAKRQVAHKLVVGQVFCAIWGYEQTNVDFYQVTRVSGASVEVREIASQKAADGSMTGYAAPAMDHFIGEPMTKRVQYGDSIRIASFAYGKLWDGRPVRYTEYA